MGTWREEQTLAGLKFQDGLQVTGKGAKQRGLGRKGKKVEEQLDLRPSQNLNQFQEVS